MMCYNFKMGKAKQFFSEVIDLLRQVTWPERDDLVRLTAVVIFVSALVGMILGGMDFVFTKIIGWFTWNQ